MAAVRTLLELKCSDLLYIISLTFILNPISVILSDMSQIY